jgi:hypothetical protein
MSGATAARRLVTLTTFDLARGAEPLIYHLHLECKT